MADARNQTTITLSWRANREFEEVAEWLGIPPASLMRFRLEMDHQSEEFQKLLQRARQREVPPQDLHQK